jgi:hypothetical protein
MAKTIEQLKKELEQIAVETRRAYDVLNTQARSGGNYYGLYRQLNVAKNTLKKKGVFASAKKDAEEKIAELEPKIKAAEAEYKKFQEQKNAIQKQIKELEAEEKETKEKEITAKSSKNQFDKALDELSQAELSIEGYKGEEKYIAAYQKAQEVYNAAINAGVTLDKPLPEAKITIPVAGQQGAGQGTEVGQQTITGPTTYSDALRFLTDPKNKESLIKAQQALSNFGYKGNTKGEPDITFTAALNKAANEYRNLPEPWRTGSLLDYIISPVPSGAGAGAGAGAGLGEPSTTLVPTIYSKTDAQAKINEVFEATLGRKPTSNELTTFRDKLIKAQEQNPATYETRVVNGKKVSKQVTGLDPAQYITNLINQTPELKSEVDKLSNTAPTINERNKQKIAYEKAIKNASPAGIEALNTTSPYAVGLKSADAKVREYVASTIGEIGDADLQKIVKQVYDSAIENDPGQIRNIVRDYIKVSDGVAPTGKSGQVLVDLKSTAMANGFDLNKIFSPQQIEGFLKKVDLGESIDTIKQQIRNIAKIGMPQNVANMLDNGIDLDVIYTPYRNIMADTFGINRETISLNDPTLRSAVTAEKEVPLYEFQRQLRQDNRWKYSKEANDEVSAMVSQVKRDFGFMG